MRMAIRWRRNSSPAPLKERHHSMPTARSATPQTRALQAARASVRPIIGRSWKIGEQDSKSADLRLMGVRFPLPAPRIHFEAKHRAGLWLFHDDVSNILFPSRRDLRATALHAPPRHLRKPAARSGRDSISRISPSRVSCAAAFPRQMGNNPRFVRPHRIRRRIGAPSLS
jgi:hypothetical protein